MTPFNYDGIKSERPSWGPLTLRDGGGHKGGDENKKKWAGWPTVGPQCDSELKNDYFTSVTMGSEGLSDACDASELADS